VSIDQSLFPSSWKVVPISEVVFFQEGPGVRKFQYTDSGVKLLNGGNINKGVLNLDTTERYISNEEAYGKYEHFLVEDGDLLIACSGVVVDKFDGKIAYAKKEHLPLCMNTSTMRFQSLDAEVLHLDYFRWFLTTTYFKRQLQKLITGSAQLNFGPSHIKQMEIPLPPLETQKQIAAVLEKADQLRKDCQKMEQELNSLAQSVFADMFIGKDFPLVNLEELAAKRKHALSSGPFGSALSSKHYTDDGVLVLRGLNTTKGNIDLSKTKYISQDKFEELKRSKLSVGDVVVVAVGSSGFAISIPAGFPEAVMSQNFNKISPDLDLIVPKYLEFTINSSFVQQQFSREITDTVRTFLSLTKLKSVQIPLPSLAQQQEFLSIINSISEKEMLNKQTFREVEDCFSSLMQKAFKGELNL